MKLSVASLRCRLRCGAVPICELSARERPRRWRRRYDSGDQKVALADPSSADRSVIDGSVKQRIIHLWVADDARRRTGPGRQR